MLHSLIADLGEVKEKAGKNSAIVRGQWSVVSGNKRTSCSLSAGACQRFNNGQRRTDHGHFEVPMWYLKHAGKDRQGFTPSGRQNRLFEGSGSGQFQRGGVTP